MIFKRDKKWILYAEIILFVAFLVIVVLGLSGAELAPLRQFFETYMPTAKPRYIFGAIIILTWLLMILIGRERRKKYGDYMDLFVECCVVLLIVQGFFIV